MVSDFFFYQLVLISLVWLCLMLPMLWPSKRASACPMPSKPAPPQRSKEPKPCAGLIHKSLCDAWEQAANPRPKAPEAPSPLLSDTKQQFCPAQDCSYFGWLERGNIHSTVHPGVKAPQPNEPISDSLLSLLPPQELNRALFSTIGTQN
jgi:hypothetical protein